MELILLWCIGANARFGKVRDLIARKRPVASGRLGSTPEVGPPAGNTRPEPEIQQVELPALKLPFSTRGLCSTAFCHRREPRIGRLYHGCELRITPERIEVRIGLCVVKQADGNIFEDRFKQF